MTKDEDGDIISKIIIGNILNNINQKNVIEKEKNIELSLKYKVLSEYTSLFAKIENENANIDKQELKLIQQNYIEESESEIIVQEENISISDNDSGTIEIEEWSPKKRPRKKKPKMMKKCINKESDMIELEKESSSEDNDSKSIEEKCYKKNPKKSKIINEDEDTEEVVEQLEDVDEDEESEIFDFKKMILTQNVISGNWTLNAQTKFLIEENKIIFHRIKNLLKSKKLGENNQDIIITILVLHCLLNKKDINRLEYTIIINKGLEYLKSFDIDYNEIKKSL